MLQLQKPYKMYYSGMFYNENINQVERKTLDLQTVVQLFVLIEKIY